MKELNGENFDDEINEGVTLVDFWAPWCSPCMTLGKVLEKIETDFKGKIKITKINIDHEPKLAQRFNVSSLPTLLMFVDGSLAKTLIGLQKPEKINSTIQTILEG